jgi:hypothetical protein
MEIPQSSMFRVHVALEQDRFPCEKIANQDTIVVGRSNRLTGLCGSANVAFQRCGLRLPGTMI